MDIDINIFEYKEKPFANGLLVHVFSPIKNTLGQDYSRVASLAAKTLEAKIGKDSAVTHNQDKVFCVPFDLGTLPQNLLLQIGIQSFEWTLSKEQIRLQPEEDSDREIIRRLLAYSIALKQIKQGWFVESYGFAYHWSYNLSKQLYTELLDVYPGFVFRPYVYNDGSCAVMIDPKFKFVSKKTLRDTVGTEPNDYKEKLGPKFYNDFVIDTCPVPDCPYKKDPSSVCRLKGSGARKRLIRLDYTKSPSKAAIGNLIEYHKKLSVCPFDGKIAERILDCPPIALVEKYRSSGYLEYPLERLRLDLKLDRLNREQRMLVMKYIQPTLNERWHLTENFASYVNDISIGKIYQLKLKRAFARAGSAGKPWENHAFFQEIPLAFANDAYSYDPFMGLERNGPCDLNKDVLRNFSAIKIALCNNAPKADLEQIRMFYNDLVEGFCRGAKFGGMKKIFNLNIPEFSEEMVYYDLRQIEELARTGKTDVVLVFTSDYGDHEIAQYEPFKSILTLKGLPSQFVLENKALLTSNPSRYVSYLKNVAISLYYKVGGVPWRLSRPVNENTCYIGLATIMRENTTFFSTQVFDANGFWIGGWTESFGVADYPHKLIERIEDAKEAYTRKKGTTPSKTILHKSGELFAKMEAGPLLDHFGKNLSCISIKKTALPRLYDPTTEQIMWCVGGVVCPALLTTTGPPNPIKGSQRPIIIEDNFDSSSSNLLKRCEEIFDLSLIHGYNLGITSNPITLHFAEKAVQLACRYNITESAKLWHKAWFL